jgi:hypothetical protein
MTADPKPERRIVDRDASRLTMLSGESCAACGGPASNCHHVVQRGAPHFGDDVIANLVLICGSGTMGCHGAHHGSPYVVEVAVDRREPGGSLRERRDAEWVNRRIGETIKARRPDVIAYVLGKLGDEPGRAFLERIYYLTLEA